MRGLHPYTKKRGSPDRYKGANTPGAGGRAPGVASGQRAAAFAGAWISRERPALNLQHSDAVREEKGFRHSVMEGVRLRPLSSSSGQK